MLSTRKALLAALLLPSLVAAQGQAPQGQVVDLQFTKTAVAGQEGVWRGTVSGEVRGDLETRLVSADESAPVMGVVFDWIVNASTPGRSFVARMEGSLNTTTGKVVMFGEVTDGWMKGARVYEAGQLVNPQNSTFEGTIVVVPGRSN